MLSVETCESKPGILTRFSREHLGGDYSAKSIITGAWSLTTKPPSRIISALASIGRAAALAKT
jgi:hypothetical protein